MRSPVHLYHLHLKPCKTNSQPISIDKCWIEEWVIIRWWICEHLFAPKNLFREMIITTWIKCTLGHFEYPEMFLNKDTVCNYNHQKVLLFYIFLPFWTTLCHGVDIRCLQTASHVWIERVLHVSVEHPTDHFIDELLLGGGLWSEPCNWGWPERV